VFQFNIIKLYRNKKYEIFYIDACKANYIISPKKISNNFHAKTFLIFRKADLIYDE